MYIDKAFVDKQEEPKNYTNKWWAIILLWTSRCGTMGVIIFQSHFWGQRNKTCPLTSCHFSFSSSLGATHFLLIRPFSFEECESKPKKYERWYNETHNHKEEEVSSGGIERKNIYQHLHKEGWKWAIGQKRLQMKMCSHILRNW